MTARITLNDGHSLPAIGFGTYPLKGGEAVTAVGSALEAGYRLLDTNELISFSRTQPSPDGEYWVCRWGEGTRTGKETKCFFGSEMF